MDQARKAELLRRWNDLMDEYEEHWSDWGREQRDGPLDEEGFYARHRRPSEILRKMREVSLELNEEPLD